jgi:hypothetical protein
MENNVGVQGVSPEFITRKELMVRLQISEPHARKLDRLGVLKSFRLGNSVRYNWKQVIEDLQKSGNGK